MKLLVVSPMETGVDYYRLRKPYHYMHFHHEDVTVDFTPSLDSPEPFGYKLQDAGYDAVIFNRMYSHSGQHHDNIVKEIKGAGIKLIMDVDDYWILPTHHLLYNEYKAKNISRRSIKSLRDADVVTCSTPYLADRVRKLNPKCYVFKNAVDPSEKQWELNKMDKDVTTVGFIGGVHHVKDMSMMRNEFKKLNDIPDEYILYYGGWVDHEHNNKIARYMGAGVNPRYTSIKAMDIYNYGHMYGMLDIAIAPLQKSEFNQCKSELKAIEAGFKKCAFVGNNIYPFKYVCNDKNSILVAKNTGFADAVTKLIREPNLREDLAEQLYEDVNRDYHISVVDAYRYEVLKGLLDG